MWIWQLIIRRAKKVTIPLTDKYCTPLLIDLTQGKRNYFNYLIRSDASVVSSTSRAAHFSNHSRASLMRPAASRASA